MKVAFATHDLATVDAHFGWAKTLALYDVTPDSATFLELLSFEGDLKEDGNEDKLTPKVEALAGVAILHVAAIGGSGAARVVQAGIHPIKVPEGTPIDELIGRLQGVLKGNPPPWLRKIMTRTGERAFSLEEEAEHA
jgi:nitrogen fixation protein NifX